MGSLWTLLGEGWACGEETGTHVKAREDSGRLSRRSLEEVEEGHLRRQELVLS